MRNRIVIEMQVNIDHGRKLIRSAYEPSEVMIYDACQPLHINDSRVYDVFSGQSDRDRQNIRDARNRLAAKLSKSLTKHLLNQWLGKDDTLNGYTKDNKVTTRDDIELEIFKLDKGE